MQRGAAGKQVRSSQRQLPCACTSHAPGIADGSARHQRVIAKGAKGGGGVGKGREVQRHRALGAHHAVVAGDLKLVGQPLQGVVLARRAGFARGVALGRVGALGAGLALGGGLIVAPGAGGALLAQLGSLLVSERAFVLVCVTRGGGGHQEG